MPRKTARAASPGRSASCARDPTDNGYVRPIEGLRPGRRSQHDEGHPRRGVRPLAAAAAASATTRPTACRTSAPTSSRSRSRSRRGRASRSTATRCAGRTGASSIGFNAREGLTLHHLRYNDGGRDRSILYRASLTEMVVPYGDPAPTQRRKNAFDVGEYGMGMCANSLELGCDCLGLIHYFDAHMVHQPRRAADDQERHLHARGRLRHPLEAHRPPAARHAGGPPLAAAGGLVGLDGRELRVRLLLVSLPGRQHSVRSQADRHPLARRAAAGREAEVRHARSRRSSTRRIISTSSTCGSISISTASANTVQQVDVVADELGADNPFENAFQAKATTLKTEKQARGHLKLRNGPDLEDRQPDSRERRRRAGRLQVPAGRQLRFRWPRRTPGGGSGPGFVELPRLGDAVSTRTRSTRAGDYPNQSTGGDGLIRWTEQDRPIENTDVVLLVHLRPHAHPAAGRLPGDADRLHRLPAQAERLLRPEPGQRRAAVGQEGRHAGPPRHGRGEGRLLPLSRQFPRYRCSPVRTRQTSNRCWNRMRSGKGAHADAGILTIH